jgi:hypothetical protein
MAPSQWIEVYEQGQTTPFRPFLPKTILNGIPGSIVETDTLQTFIPDLGQNSAGGLLLFFTFRGKNRWQLLGKFTEDGRARDGDETLPFSSIQSVQVNSLENSQNLYWASLGHAETKETIFDPAPFVLDIQLAGGARDLLAMPDEEIANRLAKAMVHAVELCTPDKKPEPF